MNELDAKIAELHKDIDAVKAEMLRRQEERRIEQENDPRRYISCTDEFSD